MNDLQAYLKGIVNNLPETPGCYQYLDDSGTIIYVGKAKNLKRRVSSYFNKDQQTRKTQMLVKHIRDIRYVVVKTEEDALLLENNLIKRYKPHYNVLLKMIKRTLPSLFRTNTCHVSSRRVNAANEEPRILVLIATCQQCMPYLTFVANSISHVRAIRL